MRPDTRERDIKTVLFFIPIPLYKWLRLTNKFNAETWSFMLFINIIFFFFILIFSFNRFKRHNNRNYGNQRNYGLLSEMSELGSGGLMIYTIDWFVH